MLLTAPLVGCKKNESDDLAKAQKCLDDVQESDPTAADKCFNYVEKYTSQQAHILKCSILTTSGGLMESKIVRGYNILKDDTQTDKTMSFMTVLSLDKPDIDAGYAKAIKANAFCLKSGVPGLVYLSGIVLAGTTFAKTMHDLSISGFDPSDPASVNTAVNALLADCAGATPSAACAENAEVLGGVVLNLSDSYCAGDSADKTVCEKIDSAVAAGGDAKDAGRALYCAMAKKTYNPSTNACE